MSDQTQHGKFRRAALASGLVSQDELDHARQQGIVHRDIKPSNLLLTPGGVVKVLDMGLARRLDADQPDDSTITQEGTVVGSLDFMSPEQARDSRDVDVRSDIYSLGCTLYFLLTGQVPFPGGSATEKLLRHQTDEPAPIESLRPEVDQHLARIVRRMMAKRAADRFRDPTDLALALTRWLEDTAAAPTLAGLVPVSLDSAETIEPGGRVQGPLADISFPSGGDQQRRGPRWGVARLATAVCAVGLLVGFGAFMLFRPDPAEPLVVATRPTAPRGPTTQLRSQAVSWKGENNLFDGYKELLAHGATAVAVDWHEWRRFWKQPDEVGNRLREVAIPSQNKTFQGLREAIRAARAGDVIEIRGAGPYWPQKVSPPAAIRAQILSAAGKPGLTIRAADGVQPVIAFRTDWGPTPDQSWRLISSDSDLTLQGLHLQAYSSAETEGMALVACAGKLVIRNSTLTSFGTRADHVVGILAARDTEVTRCAVLGTRVALALKPSPALAGDVTVSVVESLLAGGGGVAMAGEGWPGLLVLRHNTFADFSGPFLFIEPAQVEATATGNIFYRRKANHATAMFLLADPAKFRWKGKGNVYHQIDVLAETPGSGDVPPVVAQNFKQWRLKFGGQSTFDPLIVDPDLVKLSARRAGAWRVADYAFRAGGHADRRSRLGNRVGALVGEVPPAPPSQLSTFDTAPTLHVASEAATEGRPH